MSFDQTMNKKYLLSICIVFYLIYTSSCNTGSKPYLKHKVQFEKLAGNCSNLNSKFSMVSNIAGERYEFQECLNTNYNGECEVQRKGDTVVVRLFKKQDLNTLYKITLDIDTYPRYNFLTIGENTFSIIPVAN